TRPKYFEFAAGWLPDKVLCPELKIFTARGICSDLGHTSGRGRLFTIAKIIVAYRRSTRHNWATRHNQRWCFAEEHTSFDQRVRQTCSEQDHRLRFSTRQSIGI